MVVECPAGRTLLFGARVLVADDRPEPVLQQRAVCVRQHAEDVVVAGPRVLIGVIRGFIRRNWGWFGRFLAHDGHVHRYEELIEPFFRVHVLAVAHFVAAHPTAFDRDLVRVHPRLDVGTKNAVDPVLSEEVTGRRQQFAVDLLFNTFDPRQEGITGVRQRLLLDIRERAVRQLLQLVRCDAEPAAHILNTEHARHVHLALLRLDAELLIGHALLGDKQLESVIRTAVALLERLPQVFQGWLAQVVRVLENPTHRRTVAEEAADELLQGDVGTQRLTGDARQVVTALAHRTHAVNVEHILWKYLNQGLRGSDLVEQLAPHRAARRDRGRVQRPQCNWHAGTVALDLCPAVRPTQRVLEDGLPERELAHLLVR